MPKNFSNGLPLRVFAVVMIRAQNYNGQTIDGRIVVCEIHALFLFNVIP
jgi:hypothetical protein